MYAEGRGGQKSKAYRLADTIKNLADQGKVTRDDISRAFDILSEEGYIPQRRTPRILTVEAQPLVTVGNFSLEVPRHELTKPDGRICRVTPTETAILAYLMSNTPQVLSRTRIMDYCEIELDTGDRIVDVYINSIRKKIKDQPPQHVLTVRGSGYTFRP